MGPKLRYPAVIWCDGVRTHLCHPGAVATIAKDQSGHVDDAMALMITHRHVVMCEQSYLVRAKHGVRAQARKQCGAQARDGAQHGCSVRALRHRGLYPHCL